jgi:short-subunit dehydrogenase
MAYALITGSSKGIGKAIAFELAKRKFDILLTARSAELLQQTKDEIENTFSVKVNFLALDLSKNDSPKKLLAWCKENNYDVSVLINNAGYGLSGPLEKFSLEENTNLIQLNIVALTQLCQLFIPMLNKHQKAYIMNIASTAAYQSVPFLNIYAATKAYVQSFSRGLSQELSNTNISVTCISPGSTDTDWATTAQVSDKVLKLATKLNMKTSDVARAATTAMFHRKTEMVPGVINKLGIFMAWLLPKKLVEKSAANLYK